MEKKFISQMYELFIERSKFLKNSRGPNLYDLPSPEDHIEEYDSERKVRRLLDNEGNVLKETTIEEESKGKIKKPPKRKK